MAKDKKKWGTKIQDEKGRKESKTHFGPVLRKFCGKFKIILGLHSKGTLQTRCHFSSQQLLLIGAKFSKSSVALLSTLVK